MKRASFLVIALAFLGCGTPAPTTTMAAASAGGSIGGLRYAELPDDAFAVVADVRAKPGKEDELRKATEPLVAQVRNEPNNRLYFLHEDRESPGHFVFYEIFASRADFEAHNKTPHVTSWFARLSDLADGGVKVMRLSILNNKAGAPQTTAAPIIKSKGANPTMKNIVLVHGAWADGSGWQAVHDLLRARDYNVSIVQNPVTSLADDVAAVERVLARQKGPALLVGHSYGGVVITEAGASSPNVAGLMYVAAFAPDVGESVSKLIEGGQPPPLQPSKDGFLFFDSTVFPQAFAQDLPAAQGAFLAATQVPPAGAAFGTPVTKAAWKNHRSWYVVATDDRVIPPAAQRQMAARAKATITEVRGSHAVYISQPGAVAEAIDQAARAL